MGFKLKNIVSILFFLSFSNNSTAFDAPQFFDKKCSSCHSLGGGDGVGPDLKGVVGKRKREWLVKFIRESQSLIESGDPLANELFVKYKKKKMPDQELSDSEMNDLLAYLKAGKSVSANQTFKSALKANQYDIGKGRDFFLGAQPFKNGGVACLSCHRAGDVGPLGGGRLGPDLTNAYSSFNDKGLSKVLTKISFPTMVEIYKNNPLTEDEVFQVKSFLYEMDKKGKVVTGDTKKFLFLGIIGFLLVLGFFDLLWKDRRTNSRRPK